MSGDVEAQRIAVLMVGAPCTCFQGLMGALRDSDMHVLGDAANASAARQLVRETNPSVVVLNGSGCSGSMPVSEIASAVKAFPGVPVLVLAQSEEDPPVMSALQAGVAGFVVKSGRMDWLVDSVRMAAVGQVVLSPGLPQRLLDHMRRSSIDAGGTRQGSDSRLLTARELGILRLIAEGQTNRQVAKVLGISESSVKNYLHSMYSRLGVSSRSQAVTEAVRRGYLSV